MRDHNEAHNELVSHPGRAHKLKVTTGHKVFPSIASKDEVVVDFAVLTMDEDAGPFVTFREILRVRDGALPRR